MAHSSPVLGARSLASRSSQATSGITRGHALRISRATARSLPGLCSPGQRSASLQVIKGNGQPYAGSSDLDDLKDSEWCAPTYVTVDNESHKGQTIFKVDSPDYPGLLRVLAWAMNGMELRVQNAKLSVSDDGFASNKFYLTNYDGKKLKDNYAKLCAQRLSEFAFYCKPSTREHKTEFTRGNMTVSNAHHDKFSRLTITGEPDRQGFLLELCSVLSGLGMHAKSGSVQSCADCGTDVNVPEFAATSGRVFEIFLTNKENKQLDSEDANALLFVLGMLLDPASHGPTVVPNLI